MKSRVLARVAVVVLAVASAAQAGPLPAIGEEPKRPAPEAPAQIPGRSSPPDTTPYVRPVIPDDYARCGSNVGSDKAPCPSPEAAKPMPELRPGREIAPRPGQGPVPPPNFR